MTDKFDDIANFYVNTLVPNSKFESVDPVADEGLLFPPFLKKVEQCFAFYRHSHAGQDVTFTETYRSNALQLIHYNHGASKIKADGMHHFGIAADCIFVIGGKRTYKGDVMGLRSLFKQNGLVTLGMWDALHVQYIAVSEQKTLRLRVKTLID